MKGSKRISDLITNPNTIHVGRINIIEANVSAGKTWFARNTLPAWTGNPESILYLIDTSNGEAYLQRNEIMVSRQMYVFCDYNSKHVWGENEAAGKMPVMTYAGFGREVQRNRGRFNWLDFDYIVCDEMQNLVNYKGYGDEPSGDLIAAEVALQMIAATGKAKIIGMSATPRAIWKQYGSLCRNVPFDRTDLVRLETFAPSPYYQRTIEDLIHQHKGQTGILYVSDIESMKRYINYANSIGVRANGFWSIHEKPQKKDPHTPAQWALRDAVIMRETIPDDIDLLVINKASETCIKIKHENRIVDYMIVHDKNKDVQTQVRGRYDGDLAEFYYHDAYKAVYAECPSVPAEYIEVRLYREQQDALCKYLNLRDPNRGKDEHYGWRKVVEVLRANGYKVEHGRSGALRYWTIAAKCTNSEDSIDKSL